MKLNWFGVLLIVIGVSILAAMSLGHDWFNVLIRFWPVLFIIRAMNNWERIDQTKTFQVSQMALGSVLITDNFVSIPALEGVWQYWPALLVLAGLYVIAGGNGHFKVRKVIAGTNGTTAHVTTGGGASNYHIVKELAEGVQKAAVNIGFNAGKLTVEGRSPHLMEADIKTTMGEPDIRYAHGAVAELKVRQAEIGGGVIGWGESENSWNMKFNDSIPLSFDVEANAGKVDLDLTDYVVESVDLEGNAGKFTVRVGEKSPDVALNLDVNAGKVTIYVPAAAGLIASGSAALGSVDLEGAGLAKDGGVWKSPGYDGAEVKVKLMYSVNVGKITVKRY